MHDKVSIFSRSFIYFITLFFVYVLCGLKHPLEAWTPLPGITISSTASSFSPQIGMDAAGNATAIWLESNNNTGLSTIQVATLPRGASVWSAPVSISSPAANASLLLKPQIAVTPSGYSIAVWVQTINDGTSAIVQSATRSVFGGSWSSPLTISAPTTDINNLNPQVAVDPNGNAVAVWAWFNGTNHVIQAAKLPFNASFWTNLTNLSDPTKNSLFPQIALDAAGNGVAVWNQTTDSLIQSRTFSGGTWLATTYTLSSPASAFFVLPQLAMNPSGVAVAVWTSNTFVINASRFIGGTWSAPVDISTPGLPGNSEGPSIAVDIFGNALAMWNQGVASPPEVFIESAYLPIGSSMWSIPIVVTPIIVDTFFASQRAAFDAQGNATAVWAVSGLSVHFVIQAAMLPFGTNLWENLTTLSSTSLQSSIPQIAVDPSGYAVVDWNAFSLSTDFVIQATTNPAPPLPPSSFIGVVKKNKFLNKTECLLRAIWTSSISNVSSYLIYKNGVLVSTVLATDPFIFRACLRDCSPEGYEIAAVGLDGLVSNRIPLEVIHEKPCR